MNKKYLPLVEKHQEEADNMIQSVEVRFTECVLVQSVLL